MDIVVVGLNHRTAPVALREKLVLSPREQEKALVQLRKSGSAIEATLLSTCNRVEIYLAADNASEAQEIATHFLRERLQEGVSLQDALYAFSSPRSMEHLFSVASGLDSMVIGETEILGQVKEAYRRSANAGTTGAMLNRLFQKAFQVAKQVRSTTQIGAGNVSVGSVAVDLAEKIFRNLSHRQVMILGAGEMSEATARALQSRGVRSVLVSNRSLDRAQALAAQLGGRAISFENWGEEFTTVDIIISSTAAPHAILTREKLEPLMRARQNRPLFLIDIAVPRDVDPACNDLGGVFLYNIDDLQGIAQQNLVARRQEIARCEQIIHRHAARLHQKILGRGEILIPSSQPRTAVKPTVL